MLVIISVFSNNAPRCSYGRIIISERFLPVADKTIKPTTALGGTAGGLKYICGGKTTNESLLGG
jgi:hypothetical protein